MVPTCVAVEAGGGGAHVGCWHCQAVVVVSPRVWQWQWQAVVVVPTCVAVAVPVVPTCVVVEGSGSDAHVWQ